MNTQLLAGLFLCTFAAMGASKPSPCTRYPAILYVAHGFEYGITGDGLDDSALPGYTRYVDGQGGVEAYVMTGPTCEGTFRLRMTGTRKLHLVFQNWLNDGTYGPPSGTPSDPTPAHYFVLRGFSFQAPAGSSATYTTMLPIDFTAPNRTFAAGGLRFEPMSSDYLTDNPDFPTYPDMNSPCGTSAAEMKAVSATETEVSPTSVGCGAVAGPVATLIQGVKGAKGGGTTMRNVGQYGMNFKFLIVVGDGWSRPTPLP